LPFTHSCSFSPIPPSFFPRLFPFACSHSRVFSVWKG
jgi:hypothetical protein